MLVVIDSVISELPLKIALVPKQGLIKVLAPYRPDQSLDESMGTGCTGNRFDPINFKHAKIRKPLMKAKQWIVI